MEEVLTRRFRRYLAERDEGARAGKRFAYPPNLLLIDGGKGQLDVAVRVLEELGLEDICVAAWPSGSRRCTSRDGPSRCASPATPRRCTSCSRCATRRTASRSRTTASCASKKMTRSVLDDVPGLGPTRRRRLLKEFGSVKRLRELTEEELVAIPWLPDAVARATVRAAPRRVARPMTKRRLDVTVITGMSGAGRSSAADVLEDLGFFVIDNLPPALIAKVARARAGAQRPAAVRPRRRRALRRVRRRPRARARELRKRGARTRMLFLDAADDVLVRRYEASRRQHPLAAGDRVTDGIAQERRLLEDLKGEADVVVDTSDLNVHELRDRLRELFGGDDAASALRTSIVSFGYKHGLPVDVDLVFDCRFLPNPHWVDELRPLPGTDPPVREYVMRSRRRRRSSTSSSGCCACCSRRTSARARRTCRSGSAAPAAGTAAS